MADLGQREVTGGTGQGEGGEREEGGGRREEEEEDSPTGEKLNWSRMSVVLGVGEDEERCMETVWLGGRSEAGLKGRDRCPFPHRDQKKKPTTW